jgi:hypothetical protein
LLPVTLNSAKLVSLAPLLFDGGAELPVQSLPVVQAPLVALPQVYVVVINRSQPSKPACLATRDPRGRADYVLAAINLPSLECAVNQINYMMQICDKIPPDEQEFAVTAAKHIYGPV